MDDQAVWRRGAPVRFPSARWELTFSRALRRENGGRLELALPYSPARPWPLPELFCFAAVGRLAGVTRVFYGFSGSWTPAMPERGDGR